MKYWIENNPHCKFIETIKLFRIFIVCLAKIRKQSFLVKKKGLRGYFLK